MSDLYYTVSGAGSSQYKEKMSRFLSFALPIADAEEARGIVKEYQNRFHDARHVCWAYMIGPDRTEWQLNDNGEPSGTAGKPILGQINSLELTDVLVIVVRYFGGIKLGTSGLIAAYREAARLALEEAGKKELHKKRSFEIIFPYMQADGVLKHLKRPGVEIKERTFDNTCTIKVDIEEDCVDEITGKIRNLSGTTLTEC